MSINKKDEDTEPKEVLDIVWQFISYFEVVDKQEEDDDYTDKSD